VVGGCFPLMSLMPFATAGRWCGALHFRQCVRAAWRSLNAIAMPAGADPAPFVTRVLRRTVANVDSIGLVVLRLLTIGRGG
jgi:hypothetical protein